MTTVLMLLLGVVLTAGTFVFVSAEFSLVAVDQAVLDKKADEGDRGAASVLRATRTLSTQLSGAQVGITLTTILLGYTTQSALADLLVGWLGAAGLAWGLATGIAALTSSRCSLVSLSPRTSRWPTRWPPPCVSSPSRWPSP